MDNQPEVPESQAPGVEISGQPGADSPAEVTAERAAETVPVPMAELPAQDVPAPATIRLHTKHLLAIRWMHWLNFPLLALMIWSGILIYWADSDANGLHSSQVYRIGWGHWTLFRFFPLPFYQRFHLTFNLALGMGYHFFFMWLFGINGIAYVLYTWISGEWRSLVPGRDALRNAWGTVLYDLHLRRPKPPQGKYNGAQQIAYTAVVLMGFGSLLTGLAIYKPTQLHLLTWLFGGYQSARFFHFWLTIGFVVFFVVHVVQVALAGWNNFRSMIAGYEIVAAKEPAPAMETEVQP